MATKKKRSANKAAKTSMPKTGIPATFKAFRIHNDAEGYRSGIERIGIDDLSEGDMVLNYHGKNARGREDISLAFPAKIMPLPAGVGKKLWR